ncbi:MAG: hypothetical protein CL599_13575 [Alteromonas sp.]|nr:hypothetical protein [Alteromonas sp.]OUX85837.1 MAG: hypothetical protein CBB95_13175 [Alteromonas sp. TMED35]
MVKKFTLIFKEALNKGKPSELLRTEIKFDQFYYYNIVDKRERYLAAVSEVYYSVRCQFSVWNN